MTRVAYDTIGDKGSGKSRILRERMRSLTVVLPSIPPNEWKQKLATLYIGKKEEHCRIATYYRRNPFGTDVVKCDIDNKPLLDRYSVDVHHNTLPDRVEVEFWRTMVPGDRLYIYRREYEQPEQTREQLIAEGRCPECGLHGEWIRMALCCPVHHAFAGC